MKTKPASQFAFFNPRIILSFVLCSVGVFLTLLGASSKTAAQAEPSAPDIAGPVIEAPEQLSPADTNGRYVQLIEFSEPGVVRRQEHTSGERFKANTPEAQAALEQVRTEQVLHVQAIANALGHQPEVTHYFEMTHSGIATRLTPEEAQIVRMMPGVTSVERERVYEVDTFRTPFFLGADKIWDGTAVPGGVGTRGQGVVIGGLDTGLIPTHPSFVNDASCGHGVAGAPNKLLSSLDCATATGPGGLCNGASPNDSNGHGSHTNSTSGGNVVPTSAVPPPSNQISGMAPCANTRSYKVCPTSSCPAANITAGINSILLHGDVDVVNFSISGGTAPWTDNDRRFLDLVNAGIVVAASAGNTSASIPNPVGQVNHRGPWVMTVAASTKDAGGPGTGDILANFSLRGPIAGTLLNVTKPDVTGPGVNIYAAVISNYGLNSGTSMSSPHLAGSAALLRAVHPTWLPPEVKSALMMTSFNGGKKENGTTAWDPDDVGSGRVDLTQAAKAGLVMNETFANFLAADPATGGNPRNVNVPSVRDMACTPSCTWTRTVRNTKTVPTSWTATGSAITPGFIVNVSPPTFNFTGNVAQTQVVTITAIPTTNLTGAVAFGQVLFTETGAVSPNERITVAIKGQGTSSPTPTVPPATPTPTPTLSPGVTPSPSPTPSPTPTPSVSPSPSVSPTPCGVSTFTNATAITIPAGAPGVTQGAATPYPSNITVAGTTGTVTKVTVKLNNITSTFPGDVDLLLVGPGGQSAVIMSDCGGGGDVTGITITLDDAAAANMTGATLVTGTFKPTNLVGVAPEPDTWPAPAPAPPAGGASALSVFNGTNANGVWNLYVFDDASGDVGSFGGGWDLNISTTGGCGTPAPTTTPSVTPSTTPNPTATATATATATPTATATVFPSPATFPDLVLTMTDSPDPVQVGSNLTYTITVSNVDPSTAMFATMTDILPAGVNFVSATPSQGSCTGTSTVVCNLGSIAAGASATVSLVVTPTTAGTLSNTASVPDFEDPTPFNNTDTELTTVNPASSSPTPTSTPTSTPSPTTSPTATPSSTPAAQPVNLSTRMRVLTGDNVGIGGFIVTGTAPKHVLLRAIGPSVTSLPGVLADPVLELHGPAGFTTVINNNWHDDSAQAALILASGLAPTNDLEAAIDAVLNPGAYTGIVRGNGNTTGIGLVEVYDLSPLVPSKLGNISTRALVGTGNDIVIAGFILGGNSGLTNLVIRGIGPSLTGFGIANALANPTLELRDNNGAVLISNNDWQDDPVQAGQLTAAGLAPTNPMESGIAVTLSPGTYTALLAGQGGTSGVGVVEVFDRGSGGAPGPSPTPSASVAPSASPSVAPSATPVVSPPPASPTPSPSPVNCIENFDSVTAPALPTGWTAELVSGTAPTWETSTTTSDSAPNNAFVADQDGISEKRLVSRNITINSAAAVMSFRNNYITEYDPPPAEVFWDGYVADVSTDGGTTWTDIIAAGGTFVSGAYNGEIDGTANNPLAGRQAWCGNSGGYVNSVINLPASFNGQTIKIRFIMGTDEATGATGVHLDGLSISGGSCP